MTVGGLRTKGITKSSRPGEPLISVVTVVYDGAATLGQTIRSVLGQTYGNVEYVIIDGGSIDGTLDVIRSYEDRIDYWQSEPDGGIYDAMNKGIALATGEYVYVLGCDDFLVDEGIFERLKEHFLEDYDVISGTVWALDGHGWQYEFGNNYGVSVEDDLKDRVSAPHQGIFIKRSVMGRYPFDTRYKIAAEYKLNLQLWTDGSLRIKKIRDKVAYYSTEGTSARTVRLRREESQAILGELGLGASAPRLMGGNIFIRAMKRIVPDDKFWLYLKLIILRRIYRHRCGWEGCPYCSDRKVNKQCLTPR